MSFFNRLKKQPLWLRQLSTTIILVFAVSACSSAPTTNPTNPVAPTNPTHNPGEIPTETPTEPSAPDQGEVGFEGHPFSIIPPSDAHLKGTWSPVMSWPLGAIHSVLLPNSSVLTYGTDTQGRNGEGLIYDVWDPDDGFSLATHTTLPVTTQGNIFCSAQVIMPSGKVLITGGTLNTQDDANFGINDVNSFDFLNNSISRSPLSMLKGRWYPTATVLANGEVLVHGGYDEQKNPVLTPEVYTPNVGWRLLTDIASPELYDDGRWWYPRSFVAPNGLVFMLSKDNKGLWYINTEGKGSLTKVGTLEGESITDEASVVMFERGKLLAIQGNQDASIIDISGDILKVKQTTSLAKKRIWSDATLLPTGEILVTGGSSVYQSLEGVTNEAEIWNPETGLWTLGAEANKARLYHSSALLLPNGTVLTAGGGPPGPVANVNAELYYPPYLFDEDGFAERPVILSSTPLRYGFEFELRFAKTTNISKVSLIGLGSSTHSFDMGQRYLGLDFTQKGSSLVVEAPEKSELAPSGFYMLFIMNDAGVPSEGQIVSLGSAPRLLVNDLGDQRFKQNEDIFVKLHASGENLSYEAKNLPQGLSLDKATGVITGAIEQAGSYRLTLSVSDGRETQEASAIWTIEEAGRNCTVLSQEAEHGSLFGNFKITDDASASGGKYVHTDLTSASFTQLNHDHRVDICLLAPSSGSYRIKTQAHAPSASSNSFFVRIDGNPASAYLWDLDIQQGFDKHYLQERNANTTLELNLSQGEHIISIYQREPDVRLDSVSLELLSNSGDSCAGLVQEAEDGQLFGKFTASDDALASGGSFVSASNGSGNTFLGPSNDKASYCVLVPLSGEYQLKATTRASNNEDDSFFVTLNDTPSEGYLWWVPQSTDFAESYVHNKSNLVTMQLESGKNFITFHLREDGTELDKFELVKVIEP